MSDKQDDTLDPTLEAECDALLLAGEDLGEAVLSVMNLIMGYGVGQHDADGDLIKDYPYGAEHVAAYFARQHKDVRLLYWQEVHRRDQARQADLEDLYDRALRVNTALQDELGERQTDILYLQEQVSLARDLFDQARRLRGGLNEFVGSAREFQRKDKSVAKRLQVVQDPEER